MLLSPTTTSAPLLPTSAGHQDTDTSMMSLRTSISSCSLSSISRPIDINFRRGSKRSASRAINIPSPPPTPELGFGFEEDDVLPEWCQEKQENDDQAAHDDLDSIFASRYSKKNQAYERASLEEDGWAMRESTSAPSMSLLQLHTPNSLPTGFTFTSNLPRRAPKQERDSLADFMSRMDGDYWKSVSTIRSTYFFDGIGRGGGFLAIPHLASHGNAKTNVLCRLLESWLTKKLVEPTISDSIPVLEDNIQSSVESIERYLGADPRVWAGISKALIHVRCGHVFMLDSCCDDETIVHLGADEFYQEYPLFVDVEIKMHCDVNHAPGDGSEVLIAFQNVAQNKASLRPYVHRATFGCA